MSLAMAALPEKQEDSAQAKIDPPGSLPNPGRAMRLDMADRILRCPSVESEDEQTSTARKNFQAPVGTVTLPS
jgi:hypothetical protein